MSLVLHYNGQDFINQVTGEALTNNGVVHKRTEKGMSAYAHSISNNIDTGKKFNTDALGDTSIFCVVSSSLLNENGIIIGQYSYIGGLDFRVGLKINTNGSFSYFNSGSSISSTNGIIKRGKYYLLGFTLSSSGLCNLFFGNSLIKTGSLDYKWQDLNFTIGHYTTQDYISDVKVYDHILSQPEIDQLQIEFENKLILGETKTWKGIEAESKPTLFNSDILAAYTFKKNSLANLAGTKNLKGSTTFDNNSLILNGSNYVYATNFGNIIPNIATNDFTIYCRVYISSTATDQYIFIVGDSTGTGKIALYTTTSNTIIFNTIQLSGGLENGVYSSSRCKITTGWHNFVCRMKEGVAELAINGIFITPIQKPYLNISVTKELFIGKDTYGVKYFTGKISDFRFSNKAYTEQEALDYHNSFNFPVYTETFRYEGDGNIAQGHIKGTGTYEVATIDNTMVDPILNINVGDKYYKCISSGTEAFQSKQSYGTWEFSVRKVTSVASNIKVYIIADSVNISTLNGYYFNINNDKRIIFGIITNGVTSALWITPINYISTGIFYRIKITHTESGVFTIYIKGGEFGTSYQLVDVKSGTGSNPVTDNTYTTSDYTVLDLDTGDSISNIRYTSQVEV